MRFLVTGDAGFIGQHLARELDEHGHEVHGHDLVDGDLRERGVFRRRLEQVAPDAVVHLAAQVGRLFGEDDVMHTVASNALATTLVAQACGSAGVPLAYASTSEVYGDRGGVLCHEGMGLDVLPHNLYGVSKRWGEEACRLYAPDGLRVMRLSMPYGPGAPPGRGRRAMDNFLWAAHHRLPIQVHRGAERSWCWVGDTVAGVRAVVERGAYEVYNVGRDDRPVTMMRLAQLACELTGARESLIEVVDPPERQTVVKRLATRRLRALGWEPEVELPEGMREVLAWVERFDAHGRTTEWAADRRASR